MEELGCRAFENRSVSRILSPEIRARLRGGDHSSRPSVAGRLKRPTRRRSAPLGRDFGRAALSDDLPIWSCTARSLPGHACHHARRCALTLSPVGPHRFTHHPLPPPGGEGPLAGLFSVALVVAPPPDGCSRSPFAAGRPAVSGLAALWCSDFPLPRPRKGAAATARPVLNSAARGL